MGKNHKDFSGENNPNYKNGYRQSSKPHPLYNSWRGMIERCTNPKHKSYPYYGGKGISVCKKWSNSSGFIEWALMNGYKDGLSIDRKESGKNYCPSNCRWIEKSENTSRAKRQFSPTQIRKIREMLDRGIGTTAIGRAYHASPQVIDFIKKRKTYGHVK